MREFSWKANKFILEMMIKFNMNKKGIEMLYAITIALAILAIIFGLMMMIKAGKISVESLKFGW